MNRREFLLNGVCAGGARALSGLLPASLGHDSGLSAQPALSLQAPPSPAKGPLRVLKSNPRFFTDGTGKAIYLAGSHAWWNFQDNGHSLIGAEGQDPPPTFDYNAYLDLLATHHHNFFRLWRWEAPKWADDQPPGAVKYCQPHPWVRSGPGLARDAKPNFDLIRFDTDYFDRLRARVMAARDLGIYVSIMLFEGWELQFTDAWAYHPFNGANNVNGIFADSVLDVLPAEKPLHLHASAGEDIERLRTAHYGGAGYVGAGLMYNTLQNNPQGKQVLALQETYVRKIVDTVNDLDNVLYETCNEAGPYSTDWQHHIINYVKECESEKPNQHPAGMTVEYPGTNAVLYSSPADWISPNPGSSSENYLSDPSPAYTGKVIVNDTDHLCGHTCGDSLWVWKSFCRGLNVLFMEDLSPSPTWQDSARIAMGQTRDWSQRIDLAHMVPDLRSELSETKYCLANRGQEYLVFQDGSKGEFAVNLTDAPGTFAAEWFNVTTGTTSPWKVIHGGGVRTFPTPFGGPAVLHLRSTGGN
jgi:collagenase-like protein with putative collagen-binding domain